MANVLPNGKQQYTNNDGTPLAGGKALFSDAGRKYLTSGLMNVSPELERLLIGSGAVPGGLLGLQASR